MTETKEEGAVSLREASAGDAAAIAGIYNHYVVNTTITFEETHVSAEDMAGRIAEVRGASLPWLVAVQGERVIGYACASKWKGRCAYRYTVESSLYLAHDCLGKGVGKRLYAALLAAVGQRGLHAVIAGIAMPNPGSVALHESFGMTQVATFREVGFKFGRWIDVGYWQSIL